MHSTNHRRLHGGQGVPELFASMQHHTIKAQAKSIRSGVLHKSRQQALALRFGVVAERLCNSNQHELEPRAKGLKLEHEIRNNRGRSKGYATTQITLFQTQSQSRLRTFVIGHDFVGNLIWTKSSGRESQCDDGVPCIALFHARSTLSESLAQERGRRGGGGSGSLPLRRVQTWVTA
jgi:hypothetical protein